MKGGIFCTMDVCPTALMICINKTGRPGGLPPNKRFEVTPSRTLENVLLDNRVYLAFINDLSAGKGKLILAPGFIEF